MFSTSFGSALFGLLYVAMMFFGAMLMVLTLWRAVEEDKAGEFKPPSPRLNFINRGSISKWIVIGLVLLIIGAVKPIKINFQTDANRTAVRHSFDMPEYVEKERTQASNPSYTLGEIRSEAERSKQQWDSIRNASKESNQ